MATCHNCKYRHDPDRLERCLKCECQSDGQPMHVGRNAVVYADAEHGLMDALKKAPPRAHSSEGVTALPTEIEDRLRELLATFAGLEPTDALLLHHVMSGKPLAAFRATLRKIAASLPVGAGAENRDRTYAWAHTKKLVRAFQPFAAILPTNGAANKGGGGRPKKRHCFVQEILL